MSVWGRTKRALLVGFPIGSVIASFLLFPLACSVWSKGPDYRPIGFGLLGAVLAASLAMVVVVRKPVWLRVLAVLAVVVSGLMIRDAALAYLEH